jgi:GNAT superfamily N-acetyltransferase
MIRHYTPRDLPQIKPILEEWMHSMHTGELQPHEVEQTLSDIEKSPQSDDREYLVAVLDGRIVGVMGFAVTNAAMAQFARTPHPAELVNAYITGTERGKGIGQSLITAIKEVAARRGFTELVLNSGPRYRDTAWAFYDKRFERVGLIKDYFGPGYDTPVWRTKL